MMNCALLSGNCAELRAYRTAQCGISTGCAIQFATNAMLEKNAVKSTLRNCAIPTYYVGGIARKTRLRPGIAHIPSARRSEVVA